MKKGIADFLEAIAAISAFATIASVLFDCKPQEGWCPWLWLSLILLIAMGYAICRNLPKRKITLMLKNQTRLTIEKGDLFEAKGVILIPVNEYFDTHVGDGIIDPSSVHGQFINKYFANRIEELDKKINESLINVKGKTNVARTLGKRVRYPLGTCATVLDGGNKYVLFALSHFDDHNTAYLDRAEYASIIHNVLEYVTTICEANSVYIPIIGTGLSRLGLTNQRVLHYLIDVISFMELPKMQGGLNIRMKSLCKTGVDLKKIEEVFVVNKNESI